MCFLKSNICKGNWTDPNLPSVFNGKDVVKFQAILLFVHIFFLRKKTFLCSTFLFVPTEMLDLVWYESNKLFSSQWSKEKRELFIQVMGSGKICVKAFYVTVVVGHSIVSCLKNSYFSCTQQENNGARENSAYYSVRHIGKCLLSSFLFFSSYECSCISMENSFSSLFPCFSQDWALSD